MNIFLENLNIKIFQKKLAFVNIELGVQPLVDESDDNDNPSNNDLIQK